MIELTDDHYSDVDYIRVVVDNLNMHNPTGFYQFLPPEKAQEYLDRLKFHYVPKYGGWLSMAEIKLGVLKQQCPDRRICNAAPLQSEVVTWQTQRNVAD